MTDKIEVDLGDLGVCDIEYDYCAGDPSWGEPESYEFRVFYRGDEDGSKKGLDITDTLDDDQLNYIEEEIKEPLDYLNPLIRRSLSKSGD
jgi:hypothetical protein